MSRKTHTPHQRIYMAAKQGRGVYLTAEEAHQLGLQDDAIYTCAFNDWEAQGFDIESEYPFKRKKEPKA